MHNESADDAHSPQNHGEIVHDAPEHTSPGEELVDRQMNMIMDNVELSAHKPIVSQGKESSEACTCTETHHNWSCPIHGNWPEPSVQVKNESNSGQDFTSKALEEFRENCRKPGGWDMDKIEQWLASKLNEAQKVTANLPGDFVEDGIQYERARILALIESKKKECELCENREIHDTEWNQGITVLKEEIEK